jgi:hypothetical protein
MKRLLAFGFVFAFAVAMAAESVSVGDLLKDPAKYDKKVITVTGMVSKFKAKTSKAGNKYFTFTLEEKKEHIAVYGQGELSPEPKNGDRVEATGEFAKERSSGDLIFKNELDVSKKGAESKNGVKVVK